MSQEIQVLKDKAEEYRALYRAGQVTREEAVVHIAPYVDRFNEKSKEIAKKFNQRPKTISVAKFMR